MGFALALLLGAGGCESRNPVTLVVGMELNYPPFEMVDAGGKPAGISVEMAMELGKFLARRVEIQNIPFDGLIPALKTGKIDLIISSMTETPERAQSIDFSEPYLRTGLCLLVNKGSGIGSVDQVDRPGVRVVVKQGTTGQLYAQTHFHTAQILALDKEDACVLEVVQGKAQVFLYDQMSVFKHAERHAAETTALLQPIQREAWGIGIRKGNDALKEKVNLFLSNCRSQGWFEREGDKYLKEQKDAFKKLGLPFYF